MLFRPRLKIGRFCCLVLLATISLLFPCHRALADKAHLENFEATGRAVSNHDGDTFKLAINDGTLLVRFSGVDSPETGQAYWKAARRKLRSILDGQHVTVNCYKKDRYGRHVCHVFVAETDVGLELVRYGLAWYAVQFANELSAVQRDAYVEAEANARQHRVGLWSELDPQPPWACRRLRKAGNKCR